MEDEEVEVQEEEDKKAAEQREERLGRFLERRWRQREHDHRSHNRRWREDEQQGGVALLQLQLSKPLGI